MTIKELHREVQKCNCIMRAAEKRIQSAKLTARDAKLRRAVLLVALDKELLG